jgi:hypothetical protein
MGRREYVAYLDNSRIDSRGFKTSYGVTSNTLKGAKKALAKAKMYYHGTYKGCNCWISKN